MSRTENRQISEKYGLNMELAVQCAPLLAGIKPSNLLIISSHEAQQLEKVLEGTGFSYYCMAAREGKAVFFLYRITALAAYLAQEEVQSLLKELGYERCELGVLLRRVSVEYGEHLRCGSGFPHELGLLLGYPAVDVRGFMENEGKNYLYSGYWKVYGNLTETKLLFKEYSMVKVVIRQWIVGGSTISDVVERFRKQSVRSCIAV